MNQKTKRNIILGALAFGLFSAGTSLGATTTAKYSMDISATSEIITSAELPEEDTEDVVPGDTTNPGEPEGETTPKDSNNSGETEEVIPENSNSSEEIEGVIPEDSNNSEETGDVTIHLNASQIRPE